MQNEDLIRSSEALEASQARYVDLYDFAPVGYVTLNKAGMILSANLTAASLLEVPRGALLKQPLVSFILPADRDAYFLHRVLIRDTDAPQTCELRMSRPSCGQFWARLEAVPAEDPGSGTVTHRVTISDITAGKRAAEEIREEERRFRALVAAGSLVVFRLNADATGIRQLRAMDLKADTDMPVRDSLEKYVHPDDRALVMKAAKESLRTGKIFELEHRVIRADGSTGWVLNRAIPVRDENGQVIEWFGAANDISVRKHAQESLALQSEQMRALAERMRTVREEERTAVARDLHDDVGQILTAMKMDLVWIAKNLAQPEAGTLMQLRERVARSIDLIKGAMQSVHKVCAGLRPSVLDDLGLPAAIEWQANDFASRYGIACRVSVPDTDFRLDGDKATAIFRILQECLTNVARHAEARSVSASLRSENGSIVLEVIDDGKGFRSSEVPGSLQRLGILGMKERAQQWGGSVEIASSQGKGTAVTVRIPESSPSATAQQDASR
jgi:signal transduction histidine kinase